MQGANSRTMHSLSEAEIDLCVGKACGDIVVMSNEEYLIRSLNPLRLGPIWDLNKEEREQYDNAKNETKEAE